MACIDGHVSVSCEVAARGVCLVESLGNDPVLPVATGRAEPKQSSLKHIGRTLEASRCLRNDVRGRTLS